MKTLIEFMKNNNENKCHFDWNGKNNFIWDNCNTRSFFILFLLRLSFKIKNPSK